jgi:hypothetical protein
MAAPITTLCSDPPILLLHTAPALSFSVWPVQDGATLAEGQRYIKKLESLIRDQVGELQHHLQLPQGQNIYILSPTSAS